MDNKPSDSFIQGPDRKPEGMWVKLEDVTERIGEYKATLDKLRQALAAAEAECAEWRDLAGFCERWRDEFGSEHGDWYTNDGEQAPVDSADANDATRARLGLGKIGGGE